MLLQKAGFSGLRRERRHCRVCCLPLSASFRHEAAVTTSDLGLCSPSDFKPGFMFLLCMLPRLHDAGYVLRQGITNTDTRAFHLRGKRNWLLESYRISHARTGPGVEGTTTSCHHGMRVSNRSLSCNAVRVGKIYSVYAGVGCHGGQVDPLPLPPSRTSSNSNQTQVV